MQWPKTLLIQILALGSLFFLFTSASYSPALAQSPTPTLTEVGAIEISDLNLLNPAGLAYSPSGSTFFVIPANPAPPAELATLLITLSPFEDLLGRATIPARVDPLNLSFDSQARRLLLFDPAANELIEIKLNSSNLPDPAAIRRISTQPFDLQHPQGLTFDSAGRLFILDQRGDTFRFFE
jgi:hypothetical protein